MARDAPALRVDGRRVDAPVFYAAACDPARSCVVEACAGSGKTWMLVSRMLRALLDGTPPHEILAITFTRAAAGEMRERLDTWLAAFSTARSTHDQRVLALRERGVDAARAEALAPELGALQGRVLAAGRAVEIRTFHGWFAQLLRSSPLALLDRLGVQADAELVEDWRDHQPAVHRAFHALLLREEALRADHAAATAARGRHQLRVWLDAVWDRRVEFELADEAGVLETSVERAEDVWPELAAYDHPAESIATAAWTDLLRGAARALAAARGKLARDAAEELATALSLPPRDRFDAVWCALFTSTDDKPRALARGLPLVERLQDELQLLGDQVHQHESRGEHLRMVRLGRALLVSLADYKRAQGLADMADLERVALVLLRDGELSGWVQERLDVRVAHLLIDEFQDTSPLQWHALHAWLAGYAGAGGGASGQRAPGVFIVGDPKQSIYRFRRAEPRVFEAAARFVREGLEGSVLACDHTRRNAAPVMEVINGLFGATGELFPGFRRHTTEIGAVVASEVSTLPRVDRPPRSPSRRGDDAAQSVWRDSLDTPRLIVDEVLREREAEAVAEAVMAEIATGTRADEIYVLCRKRQSLRLVAHALERRHVGHSAVEDAMLAETPEAQDLIALLDVLVSTGHDLSLARALRSPLFGVSDLDLLSIRAPAAEGASWWRALRELDAPSPALERARSLLGRWHALVAALPPHDLLDRVVVEGDVHARYAAAVPPEQRAFALDSIDAVLAQSLYLDGGRYATPYAFVRALKKRAVKAALPVRASTVRLLTVHGAKGLEADTVFVMDTEPEPTNPPMTTLLVEWPVEAERPTRCAFVYNENRCPPSLRAALDQERRAREREELNGLYVAMSRAKRRLVFSATEPYREPTGPTWWSRVLAACPASPQRQSELLFDLPAAVAAAATTRAEIVIATLPAWSASSKGAGVGPTGSPAASARIGRAIHRALEWIVSDPAIERHEAADAAAREFGAAVAPVRHAVVAIVEHPDGARFFRGPQIRWSGNEVSMSDSGAVLRIDRLALVDGADGPVWWVLDYKLSHAPEELEGYRAQLLRYRAAVARAQPGEAVRCAFVTGEGRIVEVV
ncbi:MAG: UvrD-helicase domain-containing protein [Caldimonas sp.]